MIAGENRAAACFQLDLRNVAMRAASTHRPRITARSVTTAARFGMSNFPEVDSRDLSEV
jgi:hypothetical protein